MMAQCTQYVRHLIVIMSIIFSVSCTDPIPPLTPLSMDATILAFGDSLTFGTGAHSRSESYPALLNARIGRTVINAGVPGETSGSGLQRLAQTMQTTTPDLVILCHGGNDLIQKLDVKQLKYNLQQMIQLIQDSGAEVVLVAVPSFNLTLDVPTLYSELAIQFNIPIATDIIAKLERSPHLKSDSIHPNDAGYALFAETIVYLLQDAGALAKTF